MEKEPLGLIFRRVSHAVKKETDNNLKRLNLTMSQGLVLEYLNNTKDDELTQKAIEQHFNLQHPTVSGILKRLEKHGFITTSVNKADREYVPVKYREHDHCGNYGINTEYKIGVYLFFRLNKYK
jgi:MarR family multiple gene transcriptional regulator MgrA